MCFGASPRIYIAIQQVTGCSLARPVCPTGDSYLMICFSNVWLASRRRGSRCFDRARSEVRIRREILKLPRCWVWLRSSSNCRHIVTWSMVSVWAMSSVFCQPAQGASERACVETSIANSQVVAVSHAFLHFEVALAVFGIESRSSFDCRRKPRSHIHTQVSGTIAGFLGTVVKMTVYQHAKAIQHGVEC